jgi:hypothetical protein
MGALTAKPMAFVGRTWEFKNIPFLTFLNNLLIPVNIKFRDKNIWSLIPSNDKFFSFITDKTRFLHKQYIYNRIKTPIISSYQSTTNPKLIRVSKTFGTKYINLYKKYPIFNYIGSFGDTLNNLLNFNKKNLTLGNTSNYFTVAENISIFNRYKYKQSYKSDNFIINNKITSIILLLDINLDNEFASIYPEILKLKFQDNYKVINFIFPNTTFDYYGDRFEFIKFLNGNLNNLYTEISKFDNLSIISGNFNQVNSQTICWSLPTMYQNTNVLQLVKTLMTNSVVSFGQIYLNFNFVWHSRIKLFKFEDFSNLNNLTIVLYRVIPYITIKSAFFLISYLSNYIKFNNGISKVLFPLLLPGEFNYDDFIFDFNGYLFTYTGIMLTFDVIMLDSLLNTLIKVLSRESNIIKCKVNIIPV